MAYENFWPQYSANLSGTGTSGGYVTLATTTGLYVRQKIILSGATSLTGVIKEVLSSTVVRVGPDDGNFPGTGYDVSLFTPSATLFAPFQQIQYRGNHNSLQVVYETEPTKALRTMAVDPQGNYVAPGTISVSGSLSVTISSSDILSVTTTSSAATFQFFKVANTTLTAGNAAVGSAFSVGTITNNAVIFTAINSLDQNVGLALNGSQIQELGPSESFSLDLKSNSRVINASTTIGIWNVSATSSTGSIRFQIVS